MILIVLLLVAVVSLVLGLALASAIWLVVSLAASVLAAVVLFLVVRGQRASGGRGKVEAPAADAVMASRTQAAPADAELAMAGAGPRSGSGSSGYGAKEQAVTLNNPTGVTGSTSNGARAYVNGSTTVALDQVWVVDGYPEFHAANCATLTGRSGETIPRTQALQDGFTPCPTCQSAAVGQVWVADGYPDYHLEQCAELVGLNAEAVPHEQAVDDGFGACRTCRPDAAGALAERGSGAGATSDVSGSSDLAATAAVEPDTATDEAEPHAVTEAAVTEAAGTEAAAADATGPDSSGTDSTGADADADEAQHGDADSVQSTQAVESVVEAEALDPADAVAVVDSVEATESARAGEDDVQSAADNADSAHRTTDADVASEATAGASPGSADPAVWVADGHPDYHDGACAVLVGLDAEAIPLSQAAEEGFARCVSCAAPELPADLEGQRHPAEVWVVDGRPEFHAYGCVTLAQQQPEAVPYSQAVEDGFEACLVCDAHSPDAAAAPNVWVVDGSPDYHRADCELIADAAAEQVPHGQAVEDGFAECAVCRPDAAAGAPEVLVVDGEPNYHRAGCAALAGASTLPIPYSQAVEDGFAPCPTCQPEGAHAAHDVPSVPEPEPAAAVVEPEPEAAVVEPEPAAAVIEPEPAAAVAEPEPAPAVVEPEQEAAVVEPEPEPEPAVVEPEPEPEPEAAAVEPEPAAASVEPEPAPVVSEPAPEVAPVSHTEPAGASVEPAGQADGATAEPPSGDDTAQTSQRQVWVLNGRPRYHLEGCLIIKGQVAEPIPFDQAIADGFAPCSLCAR